MEIKEIKNEAELVECTTCMKEIPTSEAKNVEATDYVMHFCGLECYDKWMQEAESNSEKA